MVVQERHIHPTVPFFILAEMLCTEHVLDVTNSFELPNILKFPGFKSWTSISRCTWGLEYFGAILIVFLIEGGYQGNDCSLIGVRLVPMTGGGVVCVHICDINHGSGAIELIGVLDPVAFGLLDICEETLAA